MGKWPALFMGWKARDCTLIRHKCGGVSGTLETLEPLLCVPLYGSGSTGKYPKAFHLALQEGLGVACTLTHAGTLMHIHICAQPR